MKALLDQISKSETQNDYVAVYFLGSEAKSQLDAIGKIPTADEFTTAIKAKEAAVNASKEDLKNKKADAAAAADAWRLCATARGDGYRRCLFRLPSRHPADKRQGGKTRRGAFLNPLTPAARRRRHE